MRKTKEVLRLRLELGLGQRQTTRSCGMGLGAVQDCLARAAVAGIGWPLPEGLSEEELEASGVHRFAAANLDWSKIGLIPVNSQKSTRAG